MDGNNWKWATVIQNFQTYVGHPNHIIPVPLLSSHLFLTSATFCFVLFFNFAFIFVPIEITDFCYKKKNESIYPRTTWSRSFKTVQW